MVINQAAIHPTPLLPDVLDTNMKGGGVEGSHVRGGQEGGREDVKMERDAGKHTRGMTKRCRGKRHWDFP